MSEPLFKKGDQIAYVPLHAKGLSHPDVQFGFVTSMRGDTVFCRYWRKDGQELRTLANSEGCHASLLVKYISASQAKVDRLIELFEEGH